MTRQVIEVFAGIAQNRAQVAVLGLVALLTGCAAAVPQLPEPRSIVIHSGARLRVYQERMQEVN